MPRGKFFAEILATDRNITWRQAVTAISKVGCKELKFGLSYAAV
jgi:hypothetical protein